MDNISELIQKNKESFYNNDKFMCLYDSDISGMGYNQKEEVFDWHTQSLKDLIDAVIEEEEKSESTYEPDLSYQDPDFRIAQEYYEKAKQDTISKLKAIREML
jgi:hypothetical protein